MNGEQSITTRPGTVTELIEPIFNVRRTGANPQCVMALMRPATPVTKMASGTTITRILWRTSSSVRVTSRSAGAGFPIGLVRRLL